MNLKELMTEVMIQEDAEIAAKERLMGETPVEIVNEDEIYFLKDAVDNAGNKILERGMRICGQLRRVGERWLRCKQHPGYDTNHLGFGKCASHERREQGRYPSLNILNGYRAGGLGLELKELYEVRGAVLEDPALYEIKEEIIIVRHMLAKEIHSQFTDEDRVQNLIEQSVRLKATKEKLETEKLLLHTNSIKVYVGGIFNVLKKYLTPQLYSVVCKGIQEELVFPINKPMQDVLLVDAEVIDAPLRRKLPGSTL